MVLSNCKTFNSSGVPWIWTFQQGVWKLLMQTPTHFTLVLVSTTCFEIITNKRSYTIERPGFQTTSYVTIIKLIHLHRIRRNIIMETTSSPHELLWNGYKEEVIIKNVALCSTVITKYLYAQFLSNIISQLRCVSLRVGLLSRLYPLLQSTFMTTTGQSLYASSTAIAVFVNNQQIYVVIVKRFYMKLLLLIF